MTSHTFGLVLSPHPLCQAFRAEIHQALGSDLLSTSWTLKWKSADQKLKKHSSNFGESRPRPLHFALVSQKGWPSPPSCMTSFMNGPWLDLIKRDYTVTWLLWLLREVVSASFKSYLLSISTSKWVLRMPFTGWNYFFYAKRNFSIFFRIFRHK